MKAIERCHLVSRSRPLGLVLDDDACHMATFFGTFLAVNGHRRVRIFLTNNVIFEIRIFKID
jgi:hypothetical protein